MTTFSADDPFPLTEWSDSLFSPSAFGPNFLEPSALEPQSRKRARASPSKSLNNSNNNDNSNGNSIHALELAKKLQSKDTNNVNEALNTLLRLSADHDLNFALGRNGEMVVDQLVNLFDDAIGWKHGNIELDRDSANNAGDHEDEDDDDNDDLSDLVPSKKTWEHRASPSKVGAQPLDDFDWPTFCATKFAPTGLNTAMTPSHIKPSNLLSDAGNKERLKRLEIIIMIIRNLSYVQGNARFLTHSVGILRILTGSLYYRDFITGRAERGPKIDRDEIDIGAGNSGNNICVHALHAISNLVPSIDFTGRRVFLDLHLLDGELDAAQSQTKAAKSADSLDVKTLIDPKEYGKINSMGFGAIYIAKNFNIRDETFTKIPDSVIRPIVKKYIRAAFTIFPPLVSLIGLTTSRAVVMSALDLMIVLIDIEENQHMFTFISDEILYHLVRLLWKNRLGPDSLEYLDPVINMVTRVCSMKLLAGYDTAIDHELRDRALEFLVKLTALSSELKLRVGKKILSTPTDDYGITVATPTNVPNTKLYDAIIPALTTKVGRDHTNLFAAKLLQNLAAMPENRCGILYLQRKIIKALTTVSFENDQISDILLNEVLNKVA